MDTWSPYSSVLGIFYFIPLAANILKETKEDIVEPMEIKEEELLVVHTREYLNSLKVSCHYHPFHKLLCVQSSYNVALITEVAPVAVVPNFVLQRKLLSPFREQTGGTVLVSVSVCVCPSLFTVSAKFVIMHVYV